MDKLQEMLNTQRELQVRVYAEKLGLDFNNLTTEQTCAAIKDMVHWVVEESHEMTRELPFMKHWKNYTQDSIEIACMFEAARKEFIDLWHFMLNIALLLDMDSDELAAGYLEKNGINHKRQDEKY